MNIPWENHDKFGINMEFLFIKVLFFYIIINYILSCIYLLSFWKKNVENKGEIRVSWDRRQKKKKKKVKSQHWQDIATYRQFGQKKFPPNVRLSPFNLAK